MNETFPSEIRYSLVFVTQIIRGRAPVRREDTTGYDRLRQVLGVGGHC